MSSVELHWEFHASGLPQIQCEIHHVTVKVSGACRTSRARVNSNLPRDSQSLNASAYPQVNNYGRIIWPWAP